MLTKGNFIERKIKFHISEVHTYKSRKNAFNYKFVGLSSNIKMCRNFVKEEGMETKKSLLTKYFTQHISFHFLQPNIAYEKFMESMQDPHTET